mmetsp:Transcript_15148/g.26418  ORF Transcript_15148/g.26418 Transcript_15148/m.26418 type:complete len:260 (+) Transcript_15148:457-1236(+)
MLISRFSISFSSSSRICLFSKRHCLFSSSEAASFFSRSLISPDSVLDVNSLFRTRSTSFAANSSSTCALRFSFSTPTSSSPRAFFSISRSAFLSCSSCNCSSSSSTCLRNASFWNLSSSIFSSKTWMASVNSCFALVSFSTMDSRSNCMVDLDSSIKTLSASISFSLATSLLFNSSICFWDSKDCFSLTDDDCSAPLAIFSSKAFLSCSNFLIFSLSALDSDSSLATKACDAASCASKALCLSPWASSLDLVSSRDSLS